MVGRTAGVRSGTRTDGRPEVSAADPSSVALEADGDGGEPVPGYEAMERVVSPAQVIVPEADLVSVTLRGALTNDLALSTAFPSPGPVPRKLGFGSLPATTVLPSRKSKLMPGGVSLCSRRTGAVDDDAVDHALVLSV